MSRSTGTVKLAAANSDHFQRAAFKIGTILIILAVTTAVSVARGDPSLVLIHGPTVFQIWQVVDKAILDEEFLLDWLPNVLGIKGVS